MPRVLVFKETLLPASETFVLAQVQGLRRYEAVLAGLERSPISLPVEDALLLTDKAGAMASRRAKVYRRVGIAPGFHREARRFGPDLIHAHFASGGRSALPLARALRVPLLVTLHGADITVKGAASRYKALAAEAAGFLCVSEFIRGRAIDAGLPEEKLLVHFIGIDRTQFVPREHAVAGGVLFVGRLVEKKGCEYLVRAMARVQRAHPEAHLTVVGDGPLRAQLESLAEELGVSCRFLGVRSSAEVREQLRKALIFCGPSVTAGNGDSEGLGMVFAEAQAMGIPVVSSRHGGIPEIVRDGVTGLLAEERDVAGLAAAIGQLLSDASLRERLRAAALADVKERFDLATQNAGLEEIYDTFLGGSGRAAGVMAGMCNGDGDD
jgi:colanic acid/amylovoran biosynthesis glycosyltransferase